MARKRNQKEVIVIDDSEDEGTKAPKKRQKKQPTASQGSQDGKRPVLALLLSHAARQKELGVATQPALPRPRPVPIPVVEPWVVKHSPRTTADLVVHNRKVQDVRDWLLARLASVGLPVFGDSSLLISGPSGCGKSATVHALAAELGFQVVEWRTPVPTLWSEHQYQAGSGVRYNSKLDDFESFVSRTKFASLSLAPASRPASSSRPSAFLAASQSTFPAASQPAPSSSQASSHPPGSSNGRFSSQANPSSLQTPSHPSGPGYPSQAHPPGSSSGRFSSQAQPSSSQIAAHSTGSGPPLSSAGMLPMLPPQASAPTGSAQAPRLWGPALPTQEAIPSTVGEHSGKGSWIGDLPTQEGVSSRVGRSTAEAPSRRGGANGAAGPAALPRPKLVVVDDLPYAAGDEQRQRLARALGELSASSRCPVVIIMTSSSDGPPQGGSSSSSGGGGHRDIAAVLASCKATSIAFNPLTAPNITRALTRIADAEGLSENPALFKAIAERASGDLRNAIESLQLTACGKGHGGTAPAQARGKGKRGGKKRGKAAELTPEESAAVAARAGVTARDVTLGLFHALGKVLYNKRVEEGPSGSVTTSQTPLPLTADDDSDDALTGRAVLEGGSSLSEGGAALQNGLLLRALDEATAGRQYRSCAVAPRFRRAPMKSDPEDILMHSNLGATGTAAFLHENMLNFMTSIEDAADALAYLSDADCMLGSRRRGMAFEAAEDDLPGGTFGDAASALLTVRGLMYANSHPAPRSFLPMRGPQSAVAQKGLAVNWSSLLALLWAESGRVAVSTGCGAREYAAALLPFIRRMTASGSAAPALQRWLPERWSRLWNGKLSEERQGRDALGGQQSEAALPGLASSAGLNVAEDGDEEEDGEAIEDDD